MGTGDLTQMIEEHLRFDPAVEIERICGFIQSEVRRRRVHGIVLGLSGGLDSTTCAYLCARCLPPEQIHLFSLPERDSSPGPYSHAKLGARALNLPLVEQNLSDLFGLLGLYDKVSREKAADRRLIERGIIWMRWLSGAPALFPWAQEYSFGERRGWLARLINRWYWKYATINHTFIIGKVRARMLALTIRATRLDCLLLCTTDRSEWSVGFYDPHGDGVGDIAPLRHLYKTQIRELALALGVPEDIVRQPSSGDLAAGLPNETAIGLPYEQLDRVLTGMDLGLGDEDTAAAAGVSPRMVRSIRSACRLADQRRGMPLGVDNL